ncbi:unnamed protein product [Linum trigynum]|uniref:Uncharacterized protein n=1 Tax=Linum trigynum TaxID=586398 RepID=A0AAV2GLT6_9ROSI
MAVSGEGTTIYLRWQPPPPTGKTSANERVGDSAAFSSSSFLPVVGDRDELGKMKGGSRSKRREEGDSTAFSSWRRRRTTAFLSIRAHPSRRSLAATVS